MAWTITRGPVGAQAIADTSTTKNHPLGTIVQATDPTLGAGEFIYLKGVASTIVGSIVNYDDAFQTALDTSAVAGPPRALAVSMSINIDGPNYGWYQIAGLAKAAKATSTSFADGAGLGAASGLAVAVATGTQIAGAIVYAVASAVSGTAPDLVDIAINRPHDPSDLS
jgi:hypothetical protein